MINDLPEFDEHAFRKASYSDPNRECVDVARSDEVAQLRDSKTAFGSDNDGRLTVSSGEFGALLRAVR